MSWFDISIHIDVHTLAQNLVHIISYTAIVSTMILTTIIKEKIPQNLLKGLVNIHIIGYTYTQYITHKNLKLHLND